MLHLEKIDWMLAAGWIAMVVGLIGAVYSLAGSLKTRKNMELSQDDIWILLRAALTFIMWFVGACCVLTPIEGVASVIFEAMSYCLSQRTLAFVGANALVATGLFLLLRWYGRLAKKNKGNLSPDIE